jgi:hypothetical protein
MNWTQVDPSLKLLTQTRIVWTESAIDCFNSDKNCFNCPNFRTTGMNWTSKTCLMPITVQKLLDQNIQIHPRSFYKNI